MNISTVAVSGRGLVRPDEPVFRADDEALLRGRAAFETTRVYGGRPFLLAEHVERLRASAGRLRLPAPDPEECAQLARLVVDDAGGGDLALRLYWTGTTLVATAGAIDPQLDVLRERGLSLAVVRWSTGSLAGAKSMSYAENMGAQDVAARQGADDALLVSHEGIVLEAPTANVWWREGERLLTPSLELPILAGVTRALLLELAELETVEGVFPLERLLAADEVFLSSSVREVMPVSAVDLRSFELGPAARSVQRQLRAQAVGS
jgi:branched-subunit amino acid aminotransferase/4-amino-4-deoxychorismate lyase